MLAAQAPTSASAGELNNHVGVPISLARLPREARYGVFEIGMNHPGEIEPLARQVEAACRRGHQCRAGHIGYIGLRRGDRRREGRACSPAWRQAQWPCSIATAAHYERLARHARRFGVSRIVGFGRSEAAEARLVSCRPAGSRAAMLSP